MGIILISLNTWCFGDDRPTIDSLIGKRIYIEDAFAGQSFTLLKGRKGKQEYIVEWVRSGTEYLQLEATNVRFGSLVITSFVLF